MYNYVSFVKLAENHNPPNYGIVLLINSACTSAYLYVPIMIHNVILFTCKHYSKKYLCKIDIDIHNVSVYVHVCID